MSEDRRPLPEEQEQDKTVLDDAAMRQDAQPLPDTYWAQKRQQEARIRARLTELEALVLGRRLPTSRHYP